MPAPDRPLLSALVGDPEIEFLLSDVEQVQSMLVVERALAEAEAGAGLISPDAAVAIATGTSDLVLDWDDLASGMARDGVVVPALVRQLRARVGEPHGAAVHRGATSQDIIDTALVLQLAKIVPIFASRIASLQQALEAVSRAWGSQPLMAHTRMQAALPFTVADKVRTWHEPLERHRSALADIRKDVLIIQLGGPIGDRSSFEGIGDEIARRLADSLGLGLVPPWQSARDPLVAFGSLLSLLTGSLGKFGADVALMSQSEVGAVAIGNAGRSSAMPHKNNPVGAEVLVALARYNAGLTAILHQALVHENERSGAAWLSEWLTLPAMLITTGASLRTATRLAAALSFVSTAQ